jgi:hypothetical protein
VIGLTCYHFKSVNPRFVYYTTNADIATCTGLIVQLTYPLLVQSNKTVYDAFMSFKMVNGKRLIYLYRHPFHCRQYPFCGRLKVE